MTLVPRPRSMFGGRSADPFSRRTPVWWLESIRSGRRNQGAERRLRLVPSQSVGVRIAPRPFRHACGTAVTQPGPQLRHALVCRSEQVGRITFFAAFPGRSASRVELRHRNGVTESTARSSSKGGMTAWTRQGHRRRRRGTSGRAPGGSPTCCRTGSASSGAGSGRRRRSVTAVSRTGWRSGSGPDGNGIEVRCHTGGCGAGVIITELEVLIGLDIWTAFEPVVDAPVAVP